MGEHLKKRRHELGLRQKDAAANLKVDAWTFLNWENEKTEPAVPYYPRIVRFLGYDPFPVARTLGEQIRRRRAELGLSLNWLAARLGVDEGTLARWEKGIWRPMGPRRELVERFLSSS